jgi:leader peptidase (prepilin peptidase)/N-methyltransferase
MTVREWTSRYGISPKEITLCALAGLVGAGLLSVWAVVAASAFTGILIFSMLIITLTDSRRMLIPDIVSLPAIPIGIVATISSLPGRPQDLFLDHAIAGFLGATALYGLRWIYFRFRGRIGLGLGDVKLAGVAGCWVGLDFLAVTLLLAAVAALVAAARSARGSGSEKLVAGTAIPFGSFIAPAIVMTWIYLVVEQL